METKAREIFDKYGRDVYLVYKDGTKEKRRLGKTADGSMLVMNKGSKHRGCYFNGFVYDRNPVVDILPIVSKVTEADKWRFQVNRGIAILEKSKLWPTLLERFKIAAEVGYEDIHKAYQTYEERYGNPRVEDNVITQRVKEIAPKLIAVNDKGDDYINTEILWYFQNIRIKKMRFSKYQEVNNYKFNDIQKAMANNEKLLLDGDNGYDVSFEYNPELKQAWYSEEFRGCGNGHYYLAISPTHAMFYEDD